MHGQRNIKLGVTFLVDALSYEAEGRGFDSRWRYWNFSLAYFFQLHYFQEVDSTSYRNEYQVFNPRAK